MILAFRLLDDSFELYRTMRMMIVVVVLVVDVIVIFVAINDWVDSYSTRYQSDIDRDSKYDCRIDRWISNMDLVCGW